MQKKKCTKYKYNKYCHQRIKLDPNSIYLCFQRAYFRRIFNFEWKLLSHVSYLTNYRECLCSNPYFEINCPRSRRRPVTEDRQCRVRTWNAFHFRPERTIRRRFCCVNMQAVRFVPFLFSHAFSSASS